MMAPPRVIATWPTPPVLRRPGGAGARSPRSVADAERRRSGLTAKVGSPARLPKTRERRRVGPHRLLSRRGRRSRGAVLSSPSRSDGHYIRAHESHRYGR